ncbi:MAG: hypothetical protein NVSMB9_22950 [Isosphaeraceae bacterium]
MARALIVEDELEANELLAMLVQLRGYQTDSAFTGEEALDKVRRAPPDLIFLDLMLPDLTGYEVCTFLKSHKDTALIPIVMVTARVAAENRVQSYGAGADYFVPKPYTPDQIFQAMTEADAWRRDLERRGPEGEVVFTRNDEWETLRQLARLRSLLLAETPIGLDAARRLHESLVLLWTRADLWGRKQGASRIATLAFRVLPDQVVLSLRDLDHWYQGDPRPPAERWPEEVALGGFDEVLVDETRDRVKFVLRYHQATKREPEAV